MSLIYLMFVLFIIGILLLLVETFIPGFGFFGITGIILLIASMVLTVLAFPFGVFIVLGELFVVLIIVLVLYKYIKDKQLYGKLILTETLDTPKEDIGGLEYFLGKEGITKTPLKPFGMAEFNGTILEVASSGSSYIKEDTKIRVVDIVGNKIIVKDNKDTMQN